MAESNAAAASNADVQMLEDAAREAGEIALHYFRGDNKVWKKTGNSPVSEADIEVDSYLRRVLRQARPSHGWLSEETVDNPDRLDLSEVFIVDPIDGTRGFVEGRNEWCISVAIVRNGSPHAAVLHCPALDRTYTALLGEGAQLNGKALVPPKKNEIRVLTGSRKLNDTITEKFGQRYEVIPSIPSLAYRIALVASSEIDGAFAHGGSHEWDLAAADLIIAESGGAITTRAGKAITYNGDDIRMPALVISAAGLKNDLLELAKSGGFLH